MNDRVQPDSWSSWSSNWHGQRAAPASPVVVNTNNEDTSRKRTSTEEPNEKAKKPKIVVVDVETDTPIYPSEDAKDNLSVNESICSNSSNPDTSMKDQSKNTSILLKLAKHIAKRIEDNDRLILKGLMKQYHVALVRENVIKVEWTRGYNSNRKYYGRFHPKFVEGLDLSDSAKKLKYYLEESLKGNPVLDTIQLKLSDKFGQEFRFDEDPQIKHMDKLLKELTTNISLSLTMSKDVILIRNTTSLKADLQKLAGHVLKKMKGDFVVFTEDFLNTEKKLAGNLNLLRDNIIDKLCKPCKDQSEHFTLSDLRNCQFKIHNFSDTESPDVEKKLPQEDFMENCNNFTNEAQNTTKKMQNTSAKEIHYNSNSAVANDSFSEINITFNQKALDTITSCLSNMSSKQVNFIDTDCAAIHIRKVLQVIQNIPIYSKVNGWILVKFKNFLDQSHSILEKFESTSTHLLLIEHNRSSEIIEGMDKICWKLEDIVQKSTENNPKKIVVIGDTKDLHALFKFKCNTIDEKYVNIVSQLTKESQLDLLQKIQVNLYDRRLKLAELMDKHALVNIVSTPQLLEQLLEGDLVIGCSKHQRQQSYYNAEFIQEESLLSRNRIVIVSGELGSGKSTFLQKLEDTLTKSSALTWIDSIHLDRTAVIKKLEDHTFKDSKKAINFLVELLGYQGLQKQMFSACVVGELSLKLVLLFYGFGERLLHPSKKSKKAVINILKALQSASGNINIYVTCESQSQIELEHKLNVHAFQVDPLSRQKKLEFMVDCLRRYPDSNKVDLPKRCEHLLSSYEEKNLAYLDTPLKLKILVHIHRYKLMNDSPSCTYNTQSDLCKFYECFIKNCNLDPTTTQMLERLSLIRLLTSSEQESLDLDKVQLLDEEQMVDDQSNLLMHLTFAEYFAARWLSENIDNKKIRSVVVQCIERLIVVTSAVFFDTTAQYFELYDSNKCLTYALSLIMKNLVNWFSALLQRGFFNQVHTQALLRCAVKNNKLEMVKILINYYSQSDADLIEFVDSKSTAEHGNKSALTLAAEAGNISVACELMAAGAKIKGLKPEFQQKLLRFLFDEIFKGQSDYKYVPLVEKFIVFESHVVIGSLETDREFKKLFSFFLYKGRMEVVNCLLQALHNGTVVKPRLLSTSFDLINANRNITDEDRLEMSKFLLGKLDGSLKEHANSVLEAALDSNHPRSFEYFVDHYPQGYIGFLKHAFMHNRFKALEFLLHNNGKLSEQLSLSGVTALNLALGQSNVNPRILKLLLDQGDLDKVKKPEAENPLCTALKLNRNPHLVRYLVEKRGNLLNTEDMHGMFPWCYVLLSETCTYSAKDQLDLMEYFRSKVKLEVPSNRAHQSFVFDKRRQEIARKLDFLLRIKNYNLDYENGNMDDAMPDLHKAVLDNDVDWLKFLLVHGADVDVRDPKCNRSALHLAVENKRYDMVTLLLQHAAVFDATDGNGKIPINFSSSCYNIRILLEKLAKYFYGDDLYAMLKEDATFVNCRDCQGRTLLHVAADTNYCKTISILMGFSRKYENTDQPSLDVNARDFRGDTPLHIACRKGCHQVVEKLFSLGAIFELEDANGKSPHSLVIGNGCPKNIRLFASVVNIFDALKRNEHETAKSCIEKNRFIVNVKDRNGMSVLHWIVHQKANDLLEFLFNLNSNVFISTVDLTGRTALHVAAEVDNLPAAKLLLKLGISLDTMDNKGRRAFQCGLPYTKCAKMLRDIYRLFEDLHSDEPQILVNERPENLKKYLKKLERLYNIEPYIVLNARISPDYWNSLAYQAALYNYRGVLENLFRHGAALLKPQKVNDIDEASDCKKLIREVESVLSKSDFKKDSLINEWSNSRLDDKIIVNCRNPHGETLLHSAVKWKKSQEISWLLERGANPLDATFKNYTALSAAERECSPEIVNLLKKAISVRTDSP